MNRALILYIKLEYSISIMINLQFHIRNVIITSDAAYKIVTSDFYDKCTDKMGLFTAVEGS